jgi:ankyrin repeat protein
VKELLAALKETSNFDINDTTDAEDTALMCSCDHSRVKVIELVLSILRINTNLKNNAELTALDYVKGTRKEDEIIASIQGELFLSSCR